MTQVTRRPAISVVIPCYNEADGMSELVARVARVCNDVVVDDYEIVLINDGSSDGTWQEIRDARSRNANVVGIALSRNHGHQIALSAGLSLCRGDRVLILDADLQDPPELLPEMMSIMDAGADVVYGVRQSRDGETRLKLWTAKLFYRALVAMTETNIPQDTGDFRLLSRRVLDELLRMPERQRFIRGMVSWLGFYQVPIHYHRAARFAGTTKYPIRKMIAFAVDAFTGFSVAPLRLSIALGISGAFFAIVLAAFTLASYVRNRVVPGWASITFSIALFSSLQLLMLGIIGEYVGRAYLESKQRPLYVVDEILS